MNYGYIALSRKIATDPWWAEEPFTKAQAWIDLLLMAAHKKTRRAVRAGEFMTLERGQLVASLRFLSARWKWGMKRTRLFIEEAVKLDRVIRVRETPGGTVFEIVNYDAYQLPLKGKKRREIGGVSRAQEGHTYGSRRRAHLGRAASDDVATICGTSGSEGGTQEGTPETRAQGTNRNKEEEQTTDATHPGRRPVDQVVGGASTEAAPLPPAPHAPGGRRNGSVSRGSASDAADTTRAVQEEGGASGDTLRTHQNSAAGIIRTHLWLGNTPPASCGAGWTMGRELSIWKQLVKHYPADELNLAIELVRKHGGFGDRPISLQLFRSKNGAARSTFQSCLTAARKRLARQSEGGIRIHVA